MPLVSIGGLPGSGKTTVAKLLADQLSLAYLNAGDIFRTLAQKKGMTLEEFGVFAERVPKVDQSIDARLMEIARKKKNSILEGRLAGRMLAKEGLTSTKVWLQAPLKVRASRVAQREGSSFESALAMIHERERCEWDRYYHLYRIDLNDLSVYDLIIDTEDKPPTAIAETIVEAVNGGVAT